MLAYYGSYISPNMIDTDEGYLICRNVPIGRIGEQQYSLRELNLSDPFGGDLDRMITVQRYPEDVFEAAAIASFEGKPVTDGHPPDSVGPENYAAYLKGHVQNVRREGDFLVADLYINDSLLASDVQNSVKREVSCGYLCRYVQDGQGYRQTHIRGNHVAVVPRGRAGHEVSIQDQAPPESKKKGRNYMNELMKSILSAFNAAAKEAETEETLLEEECDTSGIIEKGAQDVKLASVPKGDDLGTKMDRILELLKGMDVQPKNTEASDVKAQSIPKGDDLGTKLDKMLERLETLKKKEKPVGNEELSKVIQSDRICDNLSAQARDAALAILRNMRPVVASIQDEHTRAMVSDALLSAFREPEKMTQIADAAASNTQRAARATGKTTFEQRCQESEAAYAARNPHKHKEGQ